MANDKRLKEVEDSVRAIAEYVKQQNAKLEKQVNDKLSNIHTDEPLMSKNFTEELEDLRKKLDSVTNERHVSPIKLKSLDDFEERISGRIGKLEENVANIRVVDSSKVEQKVGGSVSTVRKEFDDFRHEIVPRLHFIEGKLNKVKDDIDEIAASANTDDVREKIESVDRKLNQALGMKNQIDEVERGIKFARELEKRVAKVEQDDPTRLRSDLSNIAKDVDSRLRLIDERMVKRDAEEFKKIYDDIGGQFHAEADSIKKLVENFEHARNNLEIRMKGMETRLSNKENEGFRQLSDDVSKRLKAENASVVDAMKRDMEEFGRVRHGLETRMHGVELRLTNKENENSKKIYDEIDKQIRNETSSLGRVRAELEERMHAVEARVSKKEGEDFKKIYDQVEGQLKDEAAAMKRDMEEFHKTRSLLEEKINGVNLMLTQRQATEFKKIYDEMDDHRNMLNKEVGKFDGSYNLSVNKLRDEMDRRVKQLEIAEKDEVKRLVESVERRMKMADEHKTALQKFTEEATKKMREDLERRMRNVEEHKLGFDNDAVRRLEEEVAGVRHLLDKESVNRMAAEKKYAEVADAVSLATGDSKMAEEIRHKINQLEEQIARVTLQDDKQIEEYVRRHVHTPQYTKLEEDLENARHVLDNEAALRLAMDKRMHEMDMSLREARDKLDGISHVEELAGLGSRIHDMEKNVKMTSVKLLTQQLNDFAKSMDRKLPNIVAREEYMREVAEINRRLRTMESPDLAPLGSRVERLERKLDDISSMVKGLHNRMPVVVE